LLYFILHSWGTRISAEMLTKPHVASAIFYAMALAGQYVLPLGCLIGAAPASRRHKRKTLTDDMAAAKSADALDGMTWREFELLVGEGERPKSAWDIRPS